MLFGSKKPVLRSIPFRAPVDVEDFLPLLRLLGVGGIFLRWRDWDRSTCEKVAVRCSVWEVYSYGGTGIGRRVRCIPMEGLGSVDV
eukprot:8309145-Pyramimonas_sp.AAC.1